MNKIFGIEPGKMSLIAVGRFILIVAIFMLPLALIVSCKPKGGELPGSVQLDVPQVYDGCGRLCVLGSLAMLMQAYNRNITYDRVVLASGAGAGYGCSLFSGGLPPQKLAFNVFRRMGFRPNMAIGPNPNPVVIFTFLKRMPPDKVDHFKNSSEAEDLLKEELTLNHPIMVHVDEFFMADRGRPDIRRRRHNPHFMVVTGYDENNYVLNDPGFCSSSACGIKIGREEFLQAWKEGGAGGEKFGPYFMLWLEPLSKQPSDRQLMEYIKRDSRSSPFYMRAFASRLKRGVGFYDPLRLFDTSTEVLGRRYLAAYLYKKGLKKTSDLYEQSASMLEKAPMCKDSKEMAQLLLKVADLEEKASKALCSAKQ